jgi:hypothetical protein
MPTVAYRIRARLWLYPGAAAWHFITVPKWQGQEIRRLLGGSARGWGSLPVEATVGTTTWRTSIFPDSKSGSYLLPVKAAVRKAEGLAAGRLVEVRLLVSDA